MHFGLISSLSRDVLGENGVGRQESPRSAGVLPAAEGPGADGGGRPPRGAAARVAAHADGDHFRFSPPALVPGAAAPGAVVVRARRSEERRVGKGCRSRGSTDELKKREQKDTTY